MRWCACPRLHDRERGPEPIPALAGGERDGCEADSLRKNLCKRLSRSDTIRGEDASKLRQAIGEHAPNPAAIELRERTRLPRGRQLRLDRVPLLLARAQPLWERHRWSAMLDRSEQGLPYAVRGTALGGGPPLRDSHTWRTAAERPPRSQGQSADATVTNSYFLDTASGELGTALLASEMTMEGSFEEWDFDEVWQFDAMISEYPTLQWQDAQ